MTWHPGRCTTLHHPRLPLGDRQHHYTHLHICNTKRENQISNSVIMSALPFEIKCYRKILRIPWIAHRTNSSILHELHLPMNWRYNFVRSQKLKYFGHVTRHNGLEKTIVQGMVRYSGKEAEESQDKYGRKTSQIRLV